MPVVKKEPNLLLSQPDKPPPAKPDTTKHEINLAVLTDCRRRISLVYVSMICKYCSFLMLILPFPVMSITPTKESIVFKFLSCYDKFKYERNFLDNIRYWT